MQLQLAKLAVQPVLLGHLTKQRVQLSCFSYRLWLCCAELTDWECLRCL
jgi:hypothetical protein